MDYLAQNETTTHGYAAGYAMHAGHRCDPPFYFRIVTLSAVGSLLPPAHFALLLPWMLLLLL